MTNYLSRRGFLSSSAAAATINMVPRMTRAQSVPFSLTATTRTLDIDGRAATVFGLLNDSGRPGIILDPGQRFRAELTNRIGEETIIHWHGQVPPNDEDGVPGFPMPLLTPGETRVYDFAPTPGTHWMHSHVPMQEMNLLAAPFIVHTAEDVAADRQEVVMLLHDFSFKSPQEVLEEITSGATHRNVAAMAGMSVDTAGAMDHGNMQMGTMGSTDESDPTQAGDMQMGAMAMDLNDFDFDAYLTNDRTLNDPEVISVEPGGRVLLRIINASAATSFWIDTGEMQGNLVAVDGHAVVPVEGRRFGMAMAQRLDIELDLPAEGGAYPVLALREGARERTGLILASTGAEVRRIGGLAEQEAPAFDADLAQESRLQAANPLVERQVDRSHMIMLSGVMQPYVWTIDGQTWGTHKPIVARSGERVALTFHNMSMMGHPMHLHGHVFQVVNINGKAVNGAIRDTVYVPPMARITVSLDAGEAARWMLHCHHMPHLSTGMMTEFAVEPRSA